MKLILIRPRQQSDGGETKDVAAAYDLIGDPEKRARYDEGEIDASGAERPPPAFTVITPGAGDRYATPTALPILPRPTTSWRRFFAVETGTICACAGRRRYRLELDFLDAVNGASSR